MCIDTALALVGGKLFLTSVKVGDLVMSAGDFPLLMFDV